MYQCLSCEARVAAPDVFKVSIQSQQRSRFGFSRTKYVGDLCVKCASQLGLADVDMLARGIAVSISAAALAASKQERMEV